MEAAESSEKRKIEKKQEETAQEEFDKLTRIFLLKLKKSRERASEIISPWKMKNYEEKKRDGIDGSLIKFLDLTLFDLYNYCDAYSRGFVQLDRGSVRSDRGSVRLDQTTAKKEIESEIKFWEGFGDLCTAERNAYEEYIHTTIYPKTEACFRKLKKIEGVIDKVKNDPTLGDPWAKDDIYDHLTLFWDDSGCDEGMKTRFDILWDLINFERYYGEEDVSAATAEYTVEKYEDLIKEVVDLLSYNNWSDISKFLRDFSTFGSLIGSELRMVFVMMMKQGNIGR